MAVDSYLLAPATARLLGIYAAAPKGSLFINGPADSDLPGVAAHLLDLIYTDDQSRTGQVYRLEKYAIESIRELLGRLARTRFNPRLPRLIVIEDCDRLEPAAQNALLKGLEEPPAGSHFLLTSARPWEVLPTILSRCQPIRMRKPLKKDLFALFPLEPPESLEQAYWATDGWPKAMEAYLQQPDSRIRKEIALAKEFLQADSTKRMKLLFAKGAPAEKEELAAFLAELLSGLWRTTRASLLLAAGKGDWQKADLWREKFLTVNALKEDLDDKLNNRIIMLNLGLKF